VREMIECPWSAKGRVMRGLAERFGTDPDAILAEGVLLGVEGGWVLMLPDPDSPEFYVYAESEAADGRPQEIMEEYVDIVKSLIEDQAMLSS
jgi:mannose-1-phosphate guanylyltransferase/phosphomannomutase